MHEKEKPSKAYELAIAAITSRKVFDEFDRAIQLHSEISLSEGDFLKDLVERNKFESCLEVGCAYGISSLFISSGLLKAPSPSYTIIDPYQHQWNNIGMLNLKRASIGFAEFVPELSEFALPRLLSSGKKIDFAFIDGWHTFDHALLDFFYISRMLKVGGIICFHDVDMPSIKKLLRYLLKYPCYQLEGSISGRTYRQPFRRRVYENLFLQPITKLSRIVPRLHRHEVFADSILLPDDKCGLLSTLVAIRKIAEDERDWKWFQQF